MKSMEFHLNNMSPSITVEEVMKLHQKKSQHQRNHQAMPLQDLLVFSRKEQPIKTIQPAKSLKDHWHQLHAHKTSKESHLNNMSASTTVEDLMKSYRKSQKSNTLSQKAKALLANSLASSSEALLIKTIQQLKSMKDHKPQLQEPMKSMEFHLNNMSPSI